ncbi:MAG TPA: DUF2933 domain-containing protein [Candidatus Methanoperedenaceae archaeon]|nr:DUF2933 domain-containing protein [Candidatus Methanoperedenaceae archaeon]
MNSRNLIIAAVCAVILVSLIWIIGVPQNILVYGVLLACPLMHLLMMRGHNHG